MTTVLERPLAGLTTGPDAERSLILDGGWAGDLAVVGGATWIAWATCDDPEPPLLAPVNWQTPLRREAPLQPGVTPDDWRRVVSRTGFALSLARLDPAADAHTISGARVLSRSSHAFEGPTLATTAGQAEPAVFWVERRAGGHALLAAIAGRPEVVAESRGAMLGPRAAAAPEGPLAVAWQQWPDDASTASPQIVVAHRERDTWSAPLPLSPESHSAWAPALTAGPDGILWCAWDAWDGSAYQVFLAHTTSTGSWTPPIQVSAPSRTTYGAYYHLAPDVAADQGGAWLVWNRSTRWGEVNHRFNHHRSLHAARVTLSQDPAADPHVQPAPGRPVLGEPGRLPVVSLPFVHSSEDEYINPQAPRIRLDPGGRPTVFYRQFRGAEFKDFGWTVCAIAHTGQDWTSPQLVGSASGSPDAPYGIAPHDGHRGDGSQGTGEQRWLLAYHAADYALTAEFQPSKPLARHRLVVEPVAVAASTPDSHDALHYAVPFGPRAPRVAPAYRSPSASNVASTARNRAPVEVTFEGTTYSLLYGDLHRHSIYSKCMSATDGDPLDHWRWVQDVAPLDFYALTEHLEYMSYLEWRRVEDLAESLAAGGVLALCGFELAIPPGHTNFFYADQRVGYDLRVACLTSATLADVWPKLDAWLPEGSVVAIRHHQGHRGNDLAPTYAPRYEPLAEVIQSRGEYPDWVNSLRRQGFHVGVAGATDHSRSAPIVQGLTGLWLPPSERTREGVLAGLRARRTFATNGARMAVFLSAQGAAASGASATAAVGMGQSGRVNGAPRLVAEVIGSRRVETVAFYRDDRLLHVAVVDSPSATVTYDDRDAPPGEHAYWVRVVQDREASGRRPHQGVAYSSPVWLTS